jgi:hypothetical protein
MTKYLVLILVIIAGYLLLFGGEETREGFQSPDDIGRHAVAALNAKDADGVLSIYAPEAVLEDALDCPGINPWVSDSEDDLRELNAMLRFRWRKPSRPIEYLGHKVSRTDRFGPGDDIQGCRATSSITRLLVRMKGRHYFYGGRSESTHGVNLIQVGTGSGWWVLKR